MILGLPFFISLLEVVLVLVFFKHEPPLFLIEQRNDIQGARLVLRRLYSEQDIEPMIEYF